ncbi:hypothetical protein [Anabaena azotica]|uniref:Uncharacterized protein n=1 Tax=Anabaena azotica FACHB-119 TaxID=947527 RepID=A0ABR8D7M6_9NOST|nr:hypothetical protein [Anabaena azotica]MBD2503185.1 hypothetical protein [Anabaena azotica FACHB-119]
MSIRRLCCPKLNIHSDLLRLPDSRETVSSSDQLRWAERHRLRWVECDRHQASRCQLN